MHSGSTRWDSSGSASIKRVAVSTEFPSAMVPVSIFVGEDPYPSDPVIVGHLEAFFFFFNWFAHLDPTSTVI